MEEDDILKKRKEKIRNWIKEPGNLILIALLIFSLIVLFYYFNLTKHQTLWWDEAEYMSTAKHWAFNTPYNINPQRPPLIPFLAFILFKIGLNDVLIKFLIEILPFLLSIFFFYLLVNEMYNKKIALVSAFILSVSWIHLFYSMRFMTDSLGFLFGVLAFYCFWHGYIENKGKVYIWLIGVFVSLSFLCRLTGVLYGVSILLFLVLTMQFNFLKSKHMWISFFLSLLTLVPYLIWSAFYYGNAFAFRSGYGQVSSLPFGWWMFQLVYDYPELGFFILFLIGLITLIPMALGLDHLILKKDKKYYNDFFILLNLVFTLAFFIYFLRSGENRWLIMMSISIFVISAKGIIYIYDISKKNLGKIIAISIVVILLCFGAYYELRHADAIIKNKIPSYKEVQETGLWIKSNSQISDTVMTISYPEMTYYTERKNYDYGTRNLTETKKIIKEYQPTFFTFSPVYETHMLSKDIIPWLQENSKSEDSLLIPIFASFMDDSRQQPGYIVYKINYQSDEFKNIKNS